MNREIMAESKSEIATTFRNLVPGVASLAIFTASVSVFTGVTTWNGSGTHLKFNVSIAACRNCSDNVPSPALVLAQCKKTLKSFIEILQLLRGHVICESGQINTSISIAVHNIAVMLITHFYVSIDNVNKVSGFNWLR